jgi:hypothetical protein
MKGRWRRSSVPTFFGATTAVAIYDDKSLLVQRDANGA